MTQVIPTVGVDGENADRNKRAMLKHFRNLVDETASKASFLAAFKRSDSSKTEAMQRSGSLKPGLSKDDPASSSGNGEGMDIDKDAASDMEENSRDPSGNLGEEEDDDDVNAEGSVDSKPQELPQGKEFPGALAEYSQCRSLALLDLCLLREESYIFLIDKSSPHVTY